MSQSRSSPPGSGRASLWLAALSRGEEALARLVSSTLDTGPAQETQQAQGDTTLVAFPYWGHVGELAMQRLAQGMTNRFPGERSSVTDGVAIGSLSLRAAPKLSICPLGPNQRVVPAWKSHGTGSGYHACTVDTSFLLSLLSLLLLASSPFISRSFFSFLLCTKGSEWFSSGPVCPQGTCGNGWGQFWLPQPEEGEFWHQWVETRDVWAQDAPPQRMIQPQTAPVSGLRNPVIGDWKACFPLT